jgi:hypothetical protein
MAEVASLWVRVELVPLPTTQRLAALFYWNPDTGEVIGDCADDIRSIVDVAMREGLNGRMGGVELTDPLHKPSELAAILSQHWMMIPEPVTEVPNFVENTSRVVN